VRKALDSLSKLPQDVRNRVIDRELVRQGNKQRAKDGRPLLKIPQPWTPQELASGKDKGKPKA
jgi:hypothetical protein